MMEFLEGHKARNSSSRMLELLPFSLFKLCVLLWIFITLYLQLRAFHYVKEPESMIPVSVLDKAGRHSVVSSVHVGGRLSKGLRRSVLTAEGSGWEWNVVGSRFGYVTLITKCSLEEAAMVLAQNLRLTGSKADLVLISTAGRCLLEDRLRLHFTDVWRGNEVENRYGSKGFNKLLAWQLTNYSKVLYLDVDVLPLVNLDHLFCLPTPAMAPDVYAATKFNSGVMLLEPSEAVFKDMMEQLDHLPSYNGGDQGFLNAYFSDWYSLPSQHRLGARYNAVLFFPDYYNPPPWFDMNSPKPFYGPIKVVHFANPWFKPWADPQVDVDADADAPKPVANVWAFTWQSTKQLLQGNGWKPLAGGMDFPGERVKGFTVQERQVLVRHGKKTMYPPVPMWEASVRDGFVTVATCAEDVLAAGVFAYTYNMAHKNAHNPRPLLLLVLRSVPKQVWAPFKVLFDKIRLVDAIPGDDGAGAFFTLLHIWNQTYFDKLVYMDPYSLILDNCHGLLEYRTFAATPSLLPPDTFSSRVLLVQPHRDTFNDMLASLPSFNCSIGNAFSQACLEEFLNLYYPDWYSKPSLHRISLSYAVDGWFKQGLMSYMSPWRSLVFDRRAAPWSRAIRKDRVMDRVESSITWVATFCKLSLDQRDVFPHLSSRLCSRKKKSKSASI